MIRPEKEAAVQEIVDILNQAKGVFVTDFKGLNVKKMNAFRQKCRESSVEYLVVKNTLARRATEKTSFDEMKAYFNGPSAIAYSYDDASAPARVITKFAKENDKPEIKMSIFEGIFYGPDKVARIAALPSKNELLAQIVTGLNSPLQGMVSGLNGLLQKFVLTLDAIKKSKES
ncbi:50S ribosomal protein L10 [bacterium]|nr:50S ribosomal protein L10 [bacterium]